MTKDELLHRAGQGNWGAFRQLGLELSQVTEAATKWARQLEGIERPWLCWNVDEDWCLVQQQLAESAGWTPIVGFDPRVGPPKKLVKTAVVIDFNKDIGLPVMYPHFPLEFAYLFAGRLAFWHSDLLVRLPLLKSLANLFLTLKDGQTAVTKHSPGLRHVFSINKQRHWELIGCTTREASRRQFESGCGWWMEFWEHPNCPSEAERNKRKRYYWDHGTGIYYWDKVVGGDVFVIKDRAIHEGHFTKIGKKDYKSSFARNSSDAQRLMFQEINENFELKTACDELDLLDFIDKVNGAI